MKLAIFSLFVALFALLVTAAQSAGQQKAVVITYPKNTPDSIVDKAKEAIKEAGGIITHEYKIIKAFAATAPATALEMVSSLSSQYNAFIEEDEIVNVQADSHKH